MFHFALLLVSATPENLALAIKEMNVAQAEMQKAPKCVIAVGTHIKAARMHLELLQEVKDFDGADSMSGAIMELGTDAKPSCPAPVLKAIAAAGAALKGAPLPPDEPELAPEPIKKAPFTKAETPPGSMKTLEDLTKVLGPKWKRIDLQSTSDRRAEFRLMLEPSKCYAFVGVAPPGTRKMAMYLFDPLAKRRAESRKGEAGMMYLCPFIGGEYTLETKVGRKEGGVTVATFVRE